MPRKAAEEASSKMIKKIPASENGVGVICLNKSGKEYRISQNTEKRRHTLWIRGGGGFEKIATAGSPYDLYPIIDWDK